MKEGRKVSIYIVEERVDELVGVFWLVLEFYYCFLDDVLGGVYMIGI